MKNSSHKLGALALLFILCGCGTTGTPGTITTELDLPIIRHYQANTPFDSVALEVQVADPQMDEFTSELREYAVSKNLKLVPPELSTIDTITLVVSSNDDAPGSNSGLELVRSYLPESGWLFGDARPVPTYRAELKFQDKMRNKVYFSSLQPPIAQLLIDELLLMWHPPLVDKSGKSNIRGPVPEYALKPTFYEITTRGYFGSIPPKANMGHQAWHELKSTRPTFTWEAFPRELDYSRDIDRANIKRVSYDFRLYPAARGQHFGVFTPIADKNFMVARDGLAKPSFTVEQELTHCTPYMWTVRANFELDGVPRHTEWAGAFNMSSWAPFRPWYWRRDVSRPLALEPYPGVMFFTVLTPKSPFAEKCEF